MDINCHIHFSPATAFISNERSDFEPKPLPNRKRSPNPSQFLITKLSAPPSVTRKISPNIYKSCPIIISVEKLKIWHLSKNCLRMWEIWANLLLPKALKTCPKSNKSPNLVTLAPPILLFYSFFLSRLLLLLPLAPALYTTTNNRHSHADVEMKSPIEIATSQLIRQSLLKSPFPIYAHETSAHTVESF